MCLVEPIAKALGAIAAAWTVAPLADTGERDLYFGVWRDGVWTVERVASGSGIVKTDSQLAVGFNAQGSPRVGNYVQLFSKNGSSWTSEANPGEVYQGADWWPDRYHTEHGSGFDAFGNYYQVIVRDPSSDLIERRKVGGNWSEEVLSGFKLGLDGSVGTLTVDANGDRSISVLESWNLGDRVYILKNTQTVGGVWSQITGTEVMSPGGPQEGQPVLCDIGDSANFMMEVTKNYLMFGFHCADGATGKCRVVFTKSGLFSADTIVASTQQGACSDASMVDNRPFFTKDQNGIDLVAYIVNYSGSSTISGAQAGVHFARHRASGGWDTELIPTTEPPNGSVMIQRPSIVVSPDGTVFVLYLIADDDPGNPMRAEVAVKPPGGTWKTYRALDQRAPGVPTISFGFSRVVLLP